MFLRIKLQDTLIEIPLTEKEFDLAKSDNLKLEWSIGDKEIKFPKGELISSQTMNFSIEANVANSCLQKIKNGEKMTIPDINENIRKEYVRTYLEEE